MRKILLPIVALILALALALSIAMPAMAQSASAWTDKRDFAPDWGKRAPSMAQSASVWTDKPDYAPGEVVTISGSGFLANAEVAVAVERPDGVTDTVAPAPVTDDTGYFTCTYQLDGIEGTYTVTATDGTNTATTTFTDNDSGYIYALQGDGKKDGQKGFWRYDIGNDNWTAMNDTPLDVEHGGALVYAGTYIYALRGDKARNFWRYDIGNDTWLAMN